MLYNTHMKSLLLKAVKAAPFLVVISALIIAQSAYAMTPTLTAYATGSGDNVQLNVNGDPNASVVLIYNTSASSYPQNSVIGNTNANGSFSIVLSTATYGISPNSLFAVSVNSQQSNSLVWPYSATSTTSTAFSLGQTTLSLQAGQTSAVTANNLNGGTIYLASNSTPSVANVSISGSQITVTAIAAGSTTANFCLSTNTSACAALSITVPSANVSPITLSQSSPSIPYGQSVSVTIGGGTGNYSIVSNSNPGVIQTTLSGASVSLYANGTSGAAAITICSTDMSSCAVINATATGSQTGSTVSFSQVNPTLSPGQITAVTVSGGTGTYYVSSNSNTNVVQTNLVNGVLTLTGISNGSAVLTVCASSGACGVTTVTVSNPGTTSFALSQSTLNMALNQTASVTASGAGGYYVSTNSNPSIVTPTINGSTITLISGANSGTSNLSICQTGGQCAALAVTVGTGTTNASNIVLSQVLSVGQGVNLFISGGAAPYYLSSNSTSAFTATIVGGNALMLYGASAGSGSVQVCGSIGGCATVNVVVVSAPASSGSTTSGTPAATGGTYQFTYNFTIGAKGADVTALQNRLTALGFYSGPVTGYYGSLTEAAVEKYQTAHGLNSLGNVGPGTRSFLNAGQ